MGASQERYSFTWTLIGAVTQIRFERRQNKGYGKTLSTCRRVHMQNDNYSSVSDMAGSPGGVATQTWVAQHHVQEFIEGCLAPRDIIVQKLQVGELPARNDESHRFIILEVKPTRRDTQLAVRGIQCKDATANKSSNYSPRRPFMPS